MKTYYIYHIPGVKIGCSNNPKARVKRQGYSQFEILEEHSDIMIASEREIELQKQYGYQKDNASQLYYKQSNRGRLGAISQIRSGINNWQRGLGRKGFVNEKHQIKMSSAGGKANLGISKPSSIILAKALNIDWTCPYCLKTGKGSGNYNRWHGNNCRYRP